MTKTIHYRSVAELLAASERPLKLAKNRTVWQSFVNRRVHSDDWYGEGVHSGQQCAQVVVAGWPVALTRMQEMVGKLSAHLPHAEGVARKIVRSDSRGRLDIHAVNTGRLSVAWVSKQRTVTRAPLPVQIIVDVCDHSGVGSRELLWRGVAAMTLSQLLQKAGYLVGIQAAIGASVHTPVTHEALVLVDVKPIGQRLDMSTLSSTIGFPGFFRHLGFFALIAAADSMGKPIKKTLGNKRDITTLMTPSTLITQLIVPAKVISESTAKDWLEECVTMLGGKQ
jgi:hypothetical protein